VVDRFDLASLRAENLIERDAFDPTAGFEFNPKSGAIVWRNRGEVRNNRGERYDVVWERDLDSAGIKIIKSGVDFPTIYFKIRDRRFDGTPLSTAPVFLESIGKVPLNECPDRCFFLGAGSWYYANPPVDTPVAGQKPVEFSIASGDENVSLKELLRAKASKLAVAPDALAEFIQDPYASIPAIITSGELNNWYNKWWQVVNRGLRGKSIPYPGQTTARGFKNFFRHAIDMSDLLLGPLGYTHLSGVPTWHYVWQLNLDQGFNPDDYYTHAAADLFFVRLKYGKLPTFAKKILGVHFLGQVCQGKGTANRNPLISWFAIVPYIMRMESDFSPKLILNNHDQSPTADDREHECNLLETLANIKEALALAPGIVTSYPLEPDRNLWHSRPIKPKTIVNL